MFLLDIDKSITYNILMRFCHDSTSPGSQGENLHSIVELNRNDVYARRDTKDENNIHGEQRND